MVFWLLGLAGSGKTTLGYRAYDYLKTQHVSTYLIDGDEVRKFFNNDLGYSIASREENIKRIIYGASVLSEAGICVIVCNISPFERLRQLAREKIKGYKQIYLNAQYEQVSKVETKEFYLFQNNEVVGKDLTFEEPMVNDLILQTHGTSEDQSFCILKEFMKRELRL